MSSITDFLYIQNELLAIEERLDRLQELVGQSVTNPTDSNAEKMQQSEDREIQFVSNLQMSTCAPSGETEK